MASGTAPVSPAPASSGVPRSVEVVEYGRYIEGQLQRTRAQVKWVEIASGMMTLLVAVLTYMMVVAVLDAWVVTSGLSTLGRWLCLAGLLAGGLLLFAWKVVPAVLRPINPVFAAYTIEQNRPSLKNGLINFLLLRSQAQPLSPVIYQAVEQRAATDLSQIEVDATIDRSRIIKLGYVLVGLTALAAVYKLVSPKDPFRSIGRMVFPWAQMVPPSRVTFDEIMPGNAEVFHGDYLELSAIVRGTRDGEPVTLHYTTADGQTVDRPVPLTRPVDGYRYVGSIPPDTDGFKQDIEYYLRAGDARSANFHVTVKAPPAIAVRSVDLEYPRYTGLSKTSQDRGDIKALEGTLVTVRATANQKISTAAIDFDCDGSRDLAMSIVGETATASFPLRLRAESDKPEHGSYLIRFTNERGHENPQPVRHTIEIVRDLPPEITFIAPADSQIELPRNGAAAIGVKARDLDYALSRVALQLELRDKPLSTETLLAETHAGEFRGQFLFDASKYPLKPGDEVLYFAEAEDNKNPPANSVRTLRQRIKIVDPVADEQRKKQIDQAKDDCRCMQDGDGRPGENGGGEAAPRDGQPDADDRDTPREEDAAADDKARPEEENADGQQDHPDDSQGGESQQQPDDRSGGGQKGSQGSSGGQKKSDGENQDQPQDQSGEGDESGEPDDKQGGGSKEGQNKKDAQDKQKGGDKQDGAAGQDQPSNDKQQSGGKQRNRQDDRVDPDTESGDAIEQINKHREKQSKPQQPKGDQEQSQQPKSQDKQQPQPADGGQKGQDEQQPGGQKGNAPAEGESGEQEEAGVESGEEGPDGDGQSGTSQQPNGKSGSKQAGQQAVSSTNQDPQGDGEEGEAIGNQGQQDSAKPGQQEGDAGTREENGEEMTDGAADGTGEKRPAGGNKSKKPGQSAKPQDDEPDDGEEGAGDEGQGDRAQGTRQGEKQQPQEKQDPDAKGGNPNQEQGNSGAGQSSKADEGSPASEEKRSARPKKQKGPLGESDHDKGDEKSPAEKAKESDSQGDQTGDKAGGGKEGDGQKSNQAGTGGSGQNTAADEGGSESEGEGNGRTSDKAGQDVEADHPTGESSQQNAGPGGQKKAGGKQPGGAKQPGQPEPGETQSQAKPPQDSPSSAGGAGDSNGETENPAAQEGAGQQGTVHPDQKPPVDQPPGAPTPAADQADEANLEFARKKTDLALEYLKDQLDQDQPDQELLDKLGWSREDMQRFVSRWEEMKSRAGQRGAEGDAARKRLEDELRGLGLRPRGTKLDGDSREKEAERTRLRDSRRSEPPPEYAEQYKAYTQGKAKGRKAGK
ncbi:MAG: hypothetical protein AB7O62_06525 [Pirellulales bacterium]